MSLEEVSKVPDPDLILWMVLSFSIFCYCLASNLCGLSPNSKYFCFVNIKALLNLSDNISLSLCLSAEILVFFSKEGCWAFSISS